MKQRVCKFQIWDKRYSRMYSEGISVQGDGTFYLERADHDGHGIEIAESESGELVLREFTGLQDKNGKDIYEGDVIVADSYPFFNDGVPGYVGVVEWEYAAWYYTLWCINTNLVGSAIGDQLGANGNDATRFRVIGNIYENPELLPTNTTEG